MTKEEAIEVLKANHPDACFEMLTEAVDMAIEALQQPEPRWIPCSERLPEYRKKVLTINKDDEYDLNHIIDEEDGEWFLNGAIAWHELPEPYKEESQ